MHSTDELADSSYQALNLCHVCIVQSVEGIHVKEEPVSKINVNS